MTDFPQDVPTADPARARADTAPDPRWFGATAAELAALTDPADPADATETWELRLYVAGQTPRSVLALANLRRYCDEHVPGRYSLEVIDLLVRPQLAEDDQILAIPTLVRRVPEPIRRIIGDLSNEERVLVGLDLRPRAAGARPASPPPSPAS